MTFLRLCAAVLLLGSAACTTSKRHMLSEEKFPARAKTEEVKLFVNEVRRPHVKVALVQSFSDAEPTAEVKKEQLEDLMREARRVGADAVMSVRQLNSRVRGFVPDERVPFPSWRQGRYELYFMRGTAIKFVDEATAAAAAQPESAIPVPDEILGRNEQLIPATETVDPEEDSRYEVLPKGLGPAY
jgi:hypothetical protein